ncbi:MAG: 5-formyltetrahydrofolate cyclo-ligase [Endomicrobium sp.]|nr:5-formyltetrahydrofolate cyclo-ligase [Endomicrobium sp.]
MRQEFVNAYTDLDKKRIRNRFLKMRETISPSLSVSESKEIVGKIQNMPIYQKAKTIMLYQAIRGEVDSQEIINLAVKDGKKVVFPAVIDKSKKTMGAFAFSESEEAGNIVMGIKQPEIKNEISKDEIDLIVVPGVVFDEDCYRVGYGQGYFDRWLKGIKKEKIVGLAYDFQIIDRVPRESFDESLGMIVSGKRIVRQKL